MVKLHWLPTLVAAMGCLAAEPGMNKLENLREIFRYPAPFGISPGVTNAPDAAQQIRNIELLLDQSCGIADEFARFAELRRTAEFLFPGKFASQIADLETRMENLRKLVQSQQSEKISASLVEFCRQRVLLAKQLDQAADGITDPDRGSDRYGFVKSFGYVLRKKRPEYEEPTPWRMMGGSYIKLAFKAPGESAVFLPGRLSSVYEYEDMTFRFSALTPAWVIDSKVPRLTARILANPPIPQRFSEKQFFLHVKSATTINGKVKYSGLVLVAENKIEAVEAADEKELKITMTAPGRLALIQIHPNDDAKTVADFYLQYLAGLPQDMIQLQKEKKITQYALSSSGKQAAYHPVSPLITASLSSPKPVSIFQKSVLTPDSFPIVFGKNGISYTLPEIPVRKQQGINIACRADNTPELYRNIKKSGADSVRLVCGYGCAWDDDAGKAREALRHNLKLAAEAGLLVGIDNHHWFPDKKEFGKWNEKKYSDEFIRRWKLMIQWAEPWRGHLLWYDLMNEPQIYSPKERVADYYELIQMAVKALRPLDAQTPFLIEVANMGNAVGAFDWVTVDDANLIIGYHDYWPHIFTHQSVPESKTGATNLVPYPAFLPMISWKAPSWRNDEEFFLYFDRWKCQGVNYPVLELAAKTGLPVDCGEFGVVGYGALMQNSGSRWMQDAFDRFRQWGFSTMVWGIHGGYTWNVPAWQETVHQNWSNK